MIEIKMPDMAKTTDELLITEWIKEIGDTVEKGDALLKVETDKAVAEVESYAKGVLREIKFEGGSKVAVGQVIAILE